MKLHSLKSWFNKPTAPCVIVDAESHSILVFWQRLQVNYKEDREIVYMTLGDGDLWIGTVGEYNNKPCILNTTYIDNIKHVLSLIGNAERALRNED